KLGRLIRTAIWLDWGALPDRPDAMIEAGLGGNPGAGRIRRRLVLATLDLDGHAVPIRLRRVKVTDADPVWVFAPQSVGNIDALYAAHAPGWIHTSMPSEWQRDSWFSLRRWELVLLPMLFLVAGGVVVA